jgi:hypothetical protein
MATVKKGVLVPAGEWWKHLRWTKRAFWGRQRQAERRMAWRELRDLDTKTHGASDSSFDDTRKTGAAHLP